MKFLDREIASVHAAALVLGGIVPPSAPPEKRREAPIKEQEQWQSGASR